MKKQKSTSDTGGWCSSRVHRGYIKNRLLARNLADLFSGSTVIGLGDGRGFYRQFIIDTGKVRIYDAYDGAPNIYNITAGQVIFR